jgi:hypothetical protein
MEINESKKIITLHLEGMPLRNIGDEMGISKDTVGSVIEKWKNGNVPFLQQSIPYENRIIEIAKFTTANQIDIDDFTKVQFDLGVLKEIGVGKDQIFSVAQILAKLKTEEIASLLSTIKGISERHINITDLGSIIDNMEKTKNNLNENIAGNNEKLQSQSKEIENNKSIIAKQNLEIDSKENVLKDIEQDIHTQKERLKISERLHKNLNDLGVKAEELETFLQTAARLQCDSKKLRNLWDIWEALPEEIDRSMEVQEIHDTLATIKKTGWDIKSALKLGNKLMPISMDRDDAILKASNLAMSFSELEKVTKRKRMEIKDMKGKIEEMKQEKSELSKEKDELIKENEKIKAYKERNMKSNSEYITETIKTKMKIKENQTQIDSGMAIAALLRSDKRVNLDLSYFNSSSPLVSNEDYKKAREKMLEFILYELRHEIAIVKFTSRGMIKIIDGDEYEKAIQVNADADWTNFKLDRANKIINDYGNDIKSLIKDALDGKENLGDISKEFSSIIENAVKTFVNEKLSSSMDKPRNDLRADVFPVKTEINGELINVMISFSSMSASLRRNLEYVKATVYGSERTLSIPICEALRFLTMELIDNTIDSNMRTEFRNSINYEKIDMETGNVNGNKITLVHFHNRDKKR